MGKLDEQLIQLINNEIEGKGGGFEEFCTLASEVVQPVVKKVFPKNETLYKKAVKQILVRMYQKIEIADMNQIQEWMERFALDVLEKNYPRETAAAKKREARPEQEPVKNEESLQKSARTEEQEQDELIAAAMAAFAKLQDDQPEEQVELPEEVQSFFEPEQPKEQDLQDTQELQIEITQPVERKSDENPAGQIAQESEELPMEDDETEDIEGFSLESDGGEDDGDEFEEEPSDISSFWSDRSNVKKILIAAIPCVIAVIVVVVLLAGGKKKQPVSVNHSMSTTAKQTETTAVSTQTQSSTQAQTPRLETQEQTEQTERTTAHQTAEQTTKKTQASTKSSATTQRTQKQDSTESPEKTDDSGDNNTQKDTEPDTEEKTKEPETQRPTEEKTTPEATEGTTQNNTKATIKKIQ